MSYPDPRKPYSCLMEWLEQNILRIENVFCPIYHIASLVTLLFLWQFWHWIDKIKKNHAALLSGNNYYSWSSYPVRLKVLCVHYHAYASCQTKDAGFVIPVSQRQKWNLEMLSNLPKLYMNDKWQSQTCPGLSSSQILALNCSATLLFCTNSSFWSMGDLFAFSESQICKLQFYRTWH